MPLAGGHDIILRVVPMLTGRVATMVAQFVTIALIGRALGPTDFGALQIALVTFVYLTFVGDLGISVLGMRDGERLATRGLIGTYVGARLILGVGALILVVIGTLLLDLRTRDAQIVAILAVGLVASSLSLRWLLQARERFAQIALIDATSAAVQLVSAVGLLVFGGGVTWAAATMASAPVVSALLTYIAIGGSLERPKFGVTSLRLVRVALPAGIAVFATSLYFYVDSILLGLFRSTTEVGYYGAAYRFVFAALALPTVANAVALPVLSRLLSGPWDELVLTLSSTSSILMYLSLPIAIATGILAPELVQFFFGSSFGPAAVPLAILIWTCVTVSANTPFAALMLARRQDRRYMLICVFGVAINLGMNLFVIPEWGVPGAAATSIVTELVVLMLIMWSTRDLAPQILLRATGSAVIPAAIMSVAVLALSGSVAAVPVGVAAWIVAGIAVGSLRPDRLRSFVSSVRESQERVIDR